jgi:3-mercaptopyruvate sulfurtransferase SseA
MSGLPTEVRLRFLEWRANVARATLRKAHAHYWRDGRSPTESEQNILHELRRLARGLSEERHYTWVDAGMPQAFAGHLPGSARVTWDDILRKPTRVLASMDALAQAFDNGDIC